MSDGHVKRCSCGTAFTRREWDGLHFCGRYADDEETLELRNCDRCNSTIAIVVVDNRGATT